MGKKKSAFALLDLEHETFVVHVAFLSFTPLDAGVYPYRKPQITDLIAKKTFTKIFVKYIDFADIFFLDLASEFSKHIWINDHIIKLVDSQQLPYGSIYSLEPAD